MEKRYRELTRRLRSICGDENVLEHEDDLFTYASDGLLQYQVFPPAAVLPGNAEEVQQVVRTCHELGIPWVARGSGSGLSGGALPIENGLLIVLTRMRRILEVDLDNQRVVVEPGVTNISISHAVAPGYFYPPDPSSQIVCSIGGNVSENSGGAHCFKYGFTTNYVTGLEVVLPDGEVVNLGGKALDSPGYDLLGAFVGSEGTLGVATKITLRVVPSPEAVKCLVAFFEGVRPAGEAVSEIVAAGTVPGAIEMMDSLSIHASEQMAHAGWPESAGAALIVELDGPAAECDERFDEVADLCRKCGATELQVARDPQERDIFWKMRKSAFPAAGRISPNYFVQDGVVPRTKLPEVLGRIESLSEEYGLKVANVFHAGDGNLHPLVCYDGHLEGEAERAEELSGLILEACLDAGGSLTGEHGVGVDKKRHMPRMFEEPDLAAFQKLRCAFDPDGLANPGKVMPTPRLCGEVPGPYRVHPLEAAGLAERFLGLTPMTAGQIVLERPASAEEVAAVLRQGQTVRPVGGRTKIHWGTAAPEPQLEISTERLDELVEHNEGDLTAVLQAGVRLADAQETFARAGQRLALDPPDGDRRATIGGIVATADSGPLRHRYGGARDLILGVQVALSDGTVARAGSRVIKNVAGYDLAKLMCGAYGTLGVICEVIVRLHPQPTQTMTVLGSGDGSGPLARAAQALTRLPLELEALDVRWDGESGAILAQASGRASRAAADTVSDVLRAEGLDVELAEDDEELWIAQRSRQRASDDEEAIVRVSYPPSELARVLKAAPRAIGRAGAGVAWVVIEPRPQALAALRAAVAPASCVLLDGPESLRAEVNVWGIAEGPELALMDRVKARFDPSGICNRGRFAGGL